MTQNEILNTLKNILSDSFEIEPASVTMDSNLYTDLDLDSIDAVDLIVALQELTGKKIKPEEFKSVRTVADVVSATEQLLAVEPA